MAQRRHLWSASTSAAVLLSLGFPMVGCGAAGHADGPVAPAGNPRITYSEEGRPASPRRLHGSTVSPRISVALSRQNLVREVSFFVDQPVTSTKVYTVDRVAPFELPRRGRSGRPYAVGLHALRAEVQLRNGRTIALQVAYTVAQTIEVASAVDGATLRSAIESASPGPLLVRPAAGQASFSVVGELEITKPSVAIERVAMSSTIEFRPTASGSSLRRSSALGFFIFGADDIILEGNTFDGQGIRKDTIIWDEPAGNTPDGWVIRNNIFRNYFTSDPEDHSQAIYVGYSTNGLIEGNTFTKNGNTSHIFFTWFGSKADPATSYPRNICVRGNTFNETAGAYSDVNFRAEIPSNANIKIQRNASNTDPEFYRSC
jgi:Right handed beta helix region